MGASRQAAREWCRRLSVVSIGCALLLSAAVPAQEAEVGAGTLQPLVSIKELMEKTITPATNTIWAYYNAPTEERQWLELEEAAITLLAATSINATGGTGPMDNEWVTDPRWQAFNQVMLNAGVDALEAIRARDHAALLTASDVLYPPCEGCHLQFNPAVTGAQ